MSYLSVWVVQSLVMVVWTRYVSTSPMSHYELGSGIFFSAGALFTHWAAHRFAGKTEGGEKP